MERQIATRISGEKYAELERLAAANERSVSAELRLALYAWLSQNIAKAAA